MDDTLNKENALSWPLRQNIIEWNIWLPLLNEKIDIVFRELSKLFIVHGRFSEFKEKEWLKGIRRKRAKKNKEVLWTSNSLLKEVYEVFCEFMASLAILWLCPKGKWKDKNAIELVWLGWWWNGRTYN